MTSTEHVPATCTLGIDLASQPKESGVCLIDWTSGQGRVVQLEDRRLTDEVLVELMLDRRVCKVGIDAPFGWPLAFIDAITAYRDHGKWIDLEANELRFRATETAIAIETGQPPLSVALSDLAWPAMRCARLLSQIASADEALDRSGAGRVVEVYPMAALRRWGAIAPGTAAPDWSYKGDAPGRRERRQEHLAGLLARLDDTLALTAKQSECFVDDDDDFDALISALVARAAHVGQTDPIPRGMKWHALREGWIHLPTPGSLPRLSPVPSE